MHYASLKFKKTNDVSIKGVFYCGRKTDDDVTIKDVLYCGKEEKIRKI